MSHSGRTAHSKALPNYQNAFLAREKLEKYLLDPITGPNGGMADVLTAWIVDTGEDYPRFITAYVA